MFDAKESAWKVSAEVAPDVPSRLQMQQNEPNLSAILLRTKERQSVVDAECREEFSPTETSLTITIAAAQEMIVIQAGDITPTTPGL